MTRQPFNEFLNSPGPSTPGGRGRGTGRGRGGYTPKRGGRGGGVYGSNTGSSKKDYSSVPFDYASINNQRYVKLERASWFLYHPD